MEGGLERGQPRCLLRELENQQTEQTRRECQRWKNWKGRKNTFWGYTSWNFEEFPTRSLNLAIASSRCFVLLKSKASGFGDISDGPFDHHYGKEGSSSCCVCLLWHIPSSHAWLFLFWKLTASCPAKLPLAHARRLYESRFQKLLVLFQHSGDTFSVYISSRLVEMQNESAVRCMLCKANSRF